MQTQAERSIVQDALKLAGRYGGFSFGNQHPTGVTAHRPLPSGVRFPNGAQAALLMTFDVEGTYGNGAGDMRQEIANYRRICAAFQENGIPATFNVVGKMAREHGPEFVEWMLDCGSEVASHSHVHDMHKRYGGDRVYHGLYGPAENREQVRDGIAALNAIRPGIVRGIRLPYGHFNEHTYDALEAEGLEWTSNVGVEDFLVPGQGFGPMPFQMQLGEKLYPLVEIPLDSQTFDWAIWMADEKTNASFVQSVRAYCEQRRLPFERTPAGGQANWRQRMRDTIESKSVFTFLCHPINLAVKSNCWGDPVEEFMLPVIQELGALHRRGEAWVCTCHQMADFYRQHVSAGVGC